MSALPSTSIAVQIATALAGNVMLAGRMSTGHCFTPVVASSSAVGVQINGIAPVLEGDPYGGPHNCGDKFHPPGVAVCRQKSVLVNGKPVHLVGDAISCGDVALGPPSIGVNIGG